MTLPLPGPGDRDPWYPTDPAQPHSAQPYPAEPYSAQPYSAQPYPSQPHPAQPYSAPPVYGMQPYAGQPAYPVPQPPHFTGAPFGVDPSSGRPFSDKSKLAAGLLQLLPGMFLGLGGIGRLYAGHAVLGTLQLVTALIGWGSFWFAVCGSFLIFPLVFFVVFAAAWLWFVVDGIVLLAGSPTDGQGRPLRA